MGTDTFGNFINDTDKTIQELVDELATRHSVGLTSRYRGKDGNREIELFECGLLSDEQLATIKPDAKVVCMDLTENNGVRELKEVRPDLFGNPQNDNALQAHLRKRDSLTPPQADSPPIRR